MDRSLTWLLALAAVSAACSEQAFLLLPEISDARSVLLHAPRSGLVVAQAYGPALEAELADNDRILRLVAFRDELSELGLSEGSVLAAPCRSCGLREPIAMLELDTEGANGTWASLEPTPSDELLSVVLPDASRCNACTVFETDTPALADGGLVSGAIVLAVDGDRALAIERASGSAFWLGREGLIERACMGSDAVVSAYSEGPHAVWLSNGTGQLVRLDPSRFNPELPCGEAVTASTAPAGEILDTIDGAPTGFAREIFALGDSGQLYRYFAGAWATVGAPLEGGNLLAAWMAPGRGMGTSDAGPILWYEDGSLRSSSLVVEGTEIYVDAVERIADVGLVLGAKPFMLLFPDSLGGYQRVAGQMPTSERVDSIVLHRGSYFMMLQGGRLRELHPTQGYCPFQILLPLHAERELVALDDGTLVMVSESLRRARPVGVSTCD